MERLLQALRNRVDTSALEAELHTVLDQTPDDAPKIGRLLTIARQQGTLTAPQFESLTAIVTRAKRVSALKTRMRPQTEPPSAATRTGQRLEDDPHTWTIARDETLYEGSVLGGRYQLERKIGEGGMGVVYVARDLVEADFSEQPFVAIKVLKPNFREHPDALRALHEEVRKSRTLSHPNIVTVYTFDRDASNVFMTMEYLEGKSLNELIEEDFARGMPLTQAWPIIEGCGRALAYAHDRGVVHSDFKPSNIFVTAGGRPKVLDFGIARAMRQGSGRKFDAGTLGALTELYSSCEMLNGEPVDQRDDVFAYGCVVYETLTGRHVFDNKSALEARDGKLKVQPVATLSKSQNKILAAALAFDRTARLSSIEEVIEGLRAQPPKGKTALGILIFALLAAAGAVGGPYLYHKYRGPDENLQFINSLLKPNAEDASTIDREQLNLLLEQGDDYLTQGREHFDPAVLSEGVSTAYGAYRAVLKLDPANRMAAEHIAEIVNLYTGQAIALRDESQFKRAAALAAIALKIDPNRASLQQLHHELEQRAAAEPVSEQ